jgi:hypothetical protein
MSGYDHWKTTEPDDLADCKHDWRCAQDEETGAVLLCECRKCPAHWEPSDTKERTL